MAEFVEEHDHRQDEQKGHDLDQDRVPKDIEAGDEVHSARFLNRWIAAGPWTYRIALYGKRAPRPNTRAHQCAWHLRREDGTRRMVEADEKDAD
ncbi:hypothetical protein GCM10011390_05260 [Aureimonas endophytica]|uniref:Uncharacterized protein n=1 Tax=Aureimonas endophytica TaxID=2027858 RepID=A0A917E1F5_9HYPH|nr:hypothetical protein GCM10011390_05260 [Aureimonas endophytica]